MVDGRAARGFVMRCRDRFGDYGLIGFAVVDLPSGRLGDFFMSCRVQRKRVENAFFEWLRASSIAEGAEELLAAYAPTERNRAAREMLMTLGFQEAGGLWRRDLEPFPLADVVAIAASTHREAA
jgi:predicted enzyme involved in methoxymalonyl-ACP biosynthesis